MLENEIEHSGSCAIIVIIIDNNCYVTNLGDSRALYSESGSKKVIQITKDHKPNDPEEKDRIYKSGGHIYQSPNGIRFNQPWRIYPGSLSVKFIYK